MRTQDARVNRDWHKNPPKTREEGFQFAEWLANGAFDEIERKYGQRPHTERTANSVLIVWPDGEITNEFEVEMIS